MKKKNTLTSVSRFLLLLTLFAIPLMSTFSQKKNRDYVNYIDQYKSLAVDHMKKYRVPASITLAQGLLESGAGNSTLARNANNHFGIKCHTGWSGGKIYKDDDHKDECFRKYKKVEHSYEDHSLFLVDRPRYKQLFTLRTTDYRSWAKGLQQAGYATDKAYANKLIKIIEDYELYRYDGKSLKDSGKPANQGSVPSNNYKHIPYKTHGLVYIIAQNGDTYQDIANEFDFKAKNLCKFNEVPEDFPLKEGDIVYFQKKKSKAIKPYYEHTIQVGESMHSISQLYGMKVNNLYKMNKKDTEYVPVEGEVLKLR